MADDSTVFKTFAPAKVNLFLHVLGRREDGYHRLESLVIFADVGDDLTFRPSKEFGLSVEGPKAKNIGAVDQNLISKAALALRTEIPDLTFGQFDLYKRLPVAAGLGGGSANAAAALRLLAHANALRPDDPRVIFAARQTGADVVVCLESQTRIMRGLGETLSKPIDLPPLPAILVNPGFETPTGSVFTKLALTSGATRKEGLLPTTFASNFEGLAEQLRTLVNDLEEPAIALVPQIADALEAVRVTPGCKLARMSGSGATVFGLFNDTQAAARAAEAIEAIHPNWWVVETILGRARGFLDGRLRCG